MSPPGQFYRLLRCNDISAVGGIEITLKESTKLTRAAEFALIAREKPFGFDNSPNACHLASLWHARPK